MSQPLENDLAMEKVTYKKANVTALVYNIAIAVFAVLLIIISYFLYQSNLNVKSLQSQLIDLESKVSGLDNRLLNVDNRTKPKEGELDLKSRIDSLDREIYFTNMQHRIEGGIVTDDFVVEKISIFALPSFKDVSKGLLSITADLSNQPEMNSHYKGSGGYDLTDRELKSKLKDLVKKVAEAYRGSEDFIKGIPKFEESSVLLTVKNYEVGKYENGTIKHKGEY